MYHDELDELIADSIAANPDFAHILDEARAEQASVHTYKRVGVKPLLARAPLKTRFGQLRGKVTMHTKRWGANQ
jgi:hypothetical protein